MAETLIHMTEEEWNAEGVRLFGQDRRQWKFICPACGYVASSQDYINAGARNNAIAFSCIGRWTGAKRDAFGNGPGPCNFAGGGLFQLNPVAIEGGNERFFAFAPADDLRFALQTQER